MSSPKSIIVEGENGNEYKFYLYPKNYDFNQFGEVGAVYMFLGFDFLENDFDVLYIGQTSRLSKRIQNHDKWDCINGYGCTHIAFILVSREKERLEIETELRHAHPSMCNDQ